jgi:hypothetical protein
MSWYKLVRTKDGYKIVFSSFLRWEAILVSAFLIIMLLFQVFVVKDRINIFVGIFITVVLVITLALSMIVDTYNISITDRTFSKKNGFLFFVKKKKYNFTDIQSISCESLDYNMKNIDSTSSKMPKGYSSGLKTYNFLLIETGDGRSYRVEYKKGDKKIFEQLVYDVNAYKNQELSL